MVTFDAYMQLRGTGTVEQIAASTQTPVEIVQSYETFVKYQLDQAVKNGQPTPGTAQLIAVWKRVHDEGNKSITYLTIDGLESRIRRIVREELQRR